MNHGGWNTNNTEDVNTKTCILKICGTENVNTDHWLGLFFFPSAEEKKEEKKEESEESDDDMGFGLFD